MRPLDRLGSVKVKLGVVVVGTVWGTMVVLAVGNRLGLSWSVRVAIASVLSLVMVQFLARGMTSPLRAMAAAASAMARGDYRRRVRASSRDEVGELARAFNAMAADLADVWSWSGAAGTTRTVDSHVAALRRKLGDDVVRTVHGVGYAVGDLA